MDLAAFGKAVSNKIRIAVMQALAARKEMTLDQCHREVSKVLPSVARETVYRSLETLVEAGLVRKRYRHDIRRLAYALAVAQVLVDLSQGIIVEQTSIASYFD